MPETTISHGTISDTLKLRDEVLNWAESEVASDLLEGTIHFVVKNNKGQVIGCASMSKEPFTTFGKKHGVRFYGFAITPEYQRQGIGSLLLQALREHAENTGETIMWANAREQATLFYIRNNFVVSMRPFIDSNTGLVDYHAFKNLRTI